MRTANNQNDAVISFPQENLSNKPEHHLLIQACLEMSVFEVGIPQLEDEITADAHRMALGIEKELLTRLGAVLTERAARKTQEEVVVLAQEDRSEFDDQELLWLSGLHKEARQFEPVDMKPARFRPWRKGAGMYQKVARLFGLSC